MKQTQGLFFRDFKNSYLPEILKEMYRDKVYDFYFQGKKDLTVLDIGANIGVFSFYAAEFCKKIYAIEPSEEHFQSLVTMVEFNRMENIEPIKAAIANKTEKRTFYHNTNTTMYSLNKAVNTLPDDAERVQCVSLDDLFKNNKIKHVDFMKIDVEGAESEIFASKGFEKVARKIDHIMGEYHTWSGVSPQMIENSIKDRGFKFRWTNSTEAAVFYAERIK